MMRSLVAKDIVLSWRFEKGRVMLLLRKAHTRWMIMSFKEHEAVHGAHGPILSAHMISGD
jgi:hypothetical protein